MSIAGPARPGRPCPSSCSWPATAKEPSSVTGAHGGPRHSQPLSHDHMPIMLSAGSGLPSAIRGLGTNSLGWLQGWALQLQSGTEHRPCI